MSEARSDNVRGAKRGVNKRRPTAKGAARNSRFWGKVLGAAVLCLLLAAGFFAARDAWDNPAFSAKFNATPAFQNKPVSSDGEDTENEPHIADNDVVNLKGETKWEHYRHIAIDALKYNDLDPAWVTTMLAMIRIESDGDAYIDNNQDIMQAAEGDGRNVLYNGIRGKCWAGTPEASIYAGAEEFSHCVDDYREYMGHEPNPKDLNDVAILTQAYNYGHRGWFSYLKRNGITEWSLDVSEAYQSIIGGVGTAQHGGRCQSAYKDFAEQGL